MSGGVGIAALAVSLGSAAFSAGSSIMESNTAQLAQERATRSRMTQARLASTMKTIEEQKKLRRTIAKRQVQAPARGVRNASGTFASMVNQDFTNFQQDQELNKLNLKSKELALQDKLMLSNSHRNSNILNSTAQFGQNVASSIFTYQNLPSQSSVEASRPSNLNSGGGLIIPEVS